MSRQSELGIVIGVFRGGCEVICGDRVRELHLTGSHARDATSLAVGDHVRFEPDSGRVVEIEERRTRLERIRPRDRGRSLRRKPQVIAANMDQVAIVTALVEPPFVPGVIDRFLLAAAAGNLRAILVANKLDLLQGSELPEAVRSYGVVVPVVAVSAHTGLGLDELRGQLRGARTVLAGHSGVGKSSLLNALRPELCLRTGELRERDRKGRHTTSRATWYRIETDTVVVDTPGIRELATTAGDPALLHDVYPDVAEHAASCQFRDCRHEREPDCAVRSAVEAGQLSRYRLDQYRKLARELRES